MMKLSTKYILFVVILHGVALGLSYFVFCDNRIFFLVAEVFILISVVIAWRLYNQLIQPLKLLMQGTDAIRDRDFNVKFLSTGKYEMDQLIKVYNQMMDELRTERTRQEQQHLFLEKLIYTSPTGILILDYDDRIQQINPKALQVLAMEERQVLGKSITALTHPVTQQIATLRSGHARTFTLNGAITYKLQKSHFIDRGFPRHFIMIEELTAEILAAEKNAYGKVIRMMAHEVNNTIGPVNSILQSTLQFMQPASQSAQPAQSALQAGQHSEALTHALGIAMERNHNLNAFMRNFADLVRVPLPDKKSIDLIPLVQRTMDLMQSKAGEKKVTFQFEHKSANDSATQATSAAQGISAAQGTSPAQGTMMIHADAQLMEQALINIIKNAIEAIGDQGTITILIHAHPRQLVIRDTGGGIAKESEEHLFSPFYSTKRDGQGIGLTLVREILTSHGFEFSLKTIADKQTEFRIVLG
jgi:two-component system, NtrC family, nitrogen regulation sensor histidine kinase NtrY